MRKAAGFMMVAAVSLLVFGQGASANVTSVLDHWSFNSDFTDSVGANTGVNSNTDVSANTLANVASSPYGGGTAPFGGGCLYTGEDYNYVKLPNTIALSATTGYTISLWYNGFRVGNNYDSICIGDQNNTQNFLAVDQAYNGVRVRMSNNSDNFTFSPTEDAGVWHQLVVAVDPTAGVSVYKDGVQQGTTNATKNSMTINAIGFGYSNLGQSAPQMMDWYGCIDEVWLCTGGASAAEVSNLYQYNSLTSPEPATLALLAIGSIASLLRRRRR